MCKGILLHNTDQYISVVLQMVETIQMAVAMCLMVGSLSIQDSDPTFGSHGPMIENLGEVRQLQNIANYNRKLLAMFPDPILQKLSGPTLTY